MQYTEDEFFGGDKFQPRQNAAEPGGSWSGCLFETFGRDWAFVQAQDPRHVWTLVENDDSQGWTICAGFHSVNRMGYFVTAKPWENEDDFVSVAD